MKLSPISVAVLVVSLLLAPILLAQSPDSPNQGAASSAASAAEVPRLIKFSGTLLDAQDRPLAGPVGVTFALHAQQTGGPALWLETQNVTPDAHGSYTVLLGANSANGVPAELFASGEARWLEVQVERQPEQPRILLVSVPYALKAKDAETLGGRPASAFLTTETLARAGSSAGAAAAAPASSAALPSSKTQSTVKKTSSAPQPAAACTSVTSDGTAAVNSIALFSAACKIQSSLMTQALINGFPGVNLAGNNAGLLLNGTGTHQVTVTSTTTGVSGRLGEDATGFFFSSDTKGKVIKFLTNNGALNEWMRITSAGNVGIGTTAPQAVLTVTGPPQPPPVSSGNGTDVPSPVLAITGGQGGNTPSIIPARGGKGADVIIRAGDGGLGPGKTACSSPNTFCGPGGSITLQPGFGGYANSQDADLSGSVLIAPGAGYVGIGTSTPGHKLEIVDQGNLGLRVQTNTPGGILASFAGYGDFQIDAPSIPGGRFIVNGAGNVGIGTVAPANTLEVKAGGTTLADAWSVRSSARFKTNVQPLLGALAKVQQLRGVSYDLKATGNHQIGLIAEEVARVLPEVVSFDPNGTDTQGLDYARLTALLIEATKEQQREIRRLAVEIRKLRKAQQAMTQLQVRLARLESQQRSAPTAVSDLQTGGPSRVSVTTQGR